MVIATGHYNSIREQTVEVEVEVEVESEVVFCIDLVFKKQLIMNTPVVDLGDISPSGHFPLAKALEQVTDGVLALVDTNAHKKVIIASPVLVSVFQSAMTGNYVFSPALEGSYTGFGYTGLAGTLNNDIDMYYTLLNYPELGEVEIQAIVLNIAEDGSYESFPVVFNIDF